MKTLDSELRLASYMLSWLWSSLCVLAAKFILATISQKPANVINKKLSKVKP